MNYIIEFRYMHSVSVAAYQRGSNIIPMSVREARVLESNSFSYGILKLQVSIRNLRVAIKKSIKQLVYGN